LAHRWTERRLRGSDTGWTILRNGLYAELIGHLLAPQNGVITAPFGSGGVAAVARQDLAEAAAIVASDPNVHSGKTYNLVGNQVITGRAVADRLGVHYRPGTLGELRRSLDAAELLPFQPAMLAFRAGFRREAHRALPLPVGSRARVARYRHFRAACSVGKWPLALTARR
jgi:NAD(P)H dehydrogenase (quinone)